MSGNNLVEYRLEQLEEWKKNIEIYLKESEDKVMTLINELITKLALLSQKVFFGSIILTGIINFIIWGGQKFFDYSADDKKSYHEKTISQSQTIKQLVDEINRLKKEQKK